MKYIGLIILNIASAGAGIFYALRLREQCSIAAQLIQMADIMAVELSFSADNSKKIIRKLCREASLSRLGFLHNIDLENINIKTGLSEADDEKVNMLFKSLGSTDVASMLKIINSFKESITASRQRYEEYCKSRSRLYVAFGILGGLAVTVVLI